MCGQPQRPDSGRRTKRVASVCMKYISSQVTNYKCFHRAQERPISFDPGFNILVGRNNVGKTALLEALSLRFPNSPHRSLASAPKASDALPGSSRIDVTYAVAGAEVKEALDGRQEPVIVPWMAGANPRSDQLANQAWDLVQGNVLTLGATFEAGNLRQVGTIAWPYPAVPSDQGGAQFGRLGPNHEWKFQGGTGGGSSENRLDTVLARALQAKVYCFRAERLHVGVHAFGNNSVLNPDASNLPEVLNSLQTQNPPRFKRYNDLVSRVFPSIQWVGVRPIPNALEVVVWEHALETERQDLAIPLLESGTGISQVLAMLYVIVTAETDRIFIIDEPNSFLHPGAVRALLEILREHPRHQYIISTHAPQTIAGLGAEARIHLLRKNANNATGVIQVNQAETAQVREVLAEVGARISDVFGAESVLWVEGATEEQCFRLIIERSLQVPLRSIALVGVRHTGDFDRRNARWALELYKRISGAGSLMPPAIGFIFDRETRTAREIEDITRQSRGAVTFLPSRMFENYLLVPGAMSSALQALGVTLSLDRATAELAARRGDPRYYPGGDASDPSAIDGAALLDDLFSALSEGKQRYAKIRDGLALTTWLIEHEPDALAAVAALLRAKLAPERASG